jgi:hypothetical protein
MGGGKGGGGGCPPGPSRTVQTGEAGLRTLEVCFGRGSWVVVRRCGGSEGGQGQAMMWTDTRHVQIENRGQVDGLLEDIIGARPPLRNLLRHLLLESVCTAANQHASST